MAVVSLKAFRAMAARLYDRIPPQFLQELHGGILVLEEACQRDDDLPDVYVLGEYIDDPYGLGRLIVLYYGSFRELFADEPESVWEEELWETLLHELRHHVESLAGVDALEREDWEELARLRDERRRLKEPAEDGSEGGGNGRSRSRQ